MTHTKDERINSLRAQLSALDDRISSKIAEAERRMQAHAPGIRIVLAEADGRALLWGKNEHQWRLIIAGDRPEVWILSAPRDVRAWAYRILYNAAGVFNEDVLADAIIAGLEAELADRPVVP